MPNIAKVLKDEIARLARKEVKPAIASLHKEAVAARRAMAALRAQVAELEKAHKAMSRNLPAPESAPASNSDDGAGGRTWISARGVRSLRGKLKLTQAQFAKLVGVTSQAVNLWEHRKGKLRLRRATLKALNDVRGIGIKEARARLGDDAPKAKKDGGKPAAKKATKPAAKKATKPRAKAPAGTKAAKAAGKRRPAKKAIQEASGS